jgi:hypothetical protein
MEDREREKKLAGYIIAISRLAGLTSDQKLWAMEGAMNSVLNGRWPVEEMEDLQAVVYEKLHLGPMWSINLIQKHVEKEMEL